MRPFLLIPVAAAILAVAPTTTRATGPFDQKLTQDQKIVHALNRLTFGPRPGDMDAVRKMGIEKWIDLQLHPERIAENPDVTAKLAVMETLDKSPAQILQDYPASSPLLRIPTVNLNDLLSQPELAKVQSGSAEDRKKVLDAMDPEKRRKVMATIAPQQFASIPELQKEAEAARRAQQEEQAKQRRMLMPPLADLLSPDQIQTAQRGTPEQVRALLAYFDPQKQQQIAAALPQQALAQLPDYRRLGAKLRQPQQIVTMDLHEGKVLRAVESERQLEEVLVDFWFNHFNVYEPKAQDRILLPSYERDAIRPHVLGHFKDLLLATAKHPAMLYYLDNWESMAQGAFDVGPFAANAGLQQQLQRVARGLNENYGRELMELHTLGVDGGYTQDDVINVARCFTGWTIRNPNTQPEFAFAGFMHDTGEKTVLGHKIAAGGGVEDGMQVMDILVHHSSTAHFISKELAQRFVADDPPESLVSRMAQTFTKTDGDLRAVLATMFASPEFFSQGAFQAKVKSPFESVVSAVRAVGGDPVDTFAMAQKIADMGEPLYNKLEPTGYPNNGESWLNTAGLLARFNFATVLTSGQMAGVKFDVARWDGKDAAAVARDLLGSEPSSQTEEAIAKGLTGRAPTVGYVAGLVLSSPDFQRR